MSMSEHEVSRVLSAPPSAAFAVASDVGRLPEWLPTVHITAGKTDGEVHVEGDSPAGHYENDGLWRTQPDQLRVEWSSESHGAPQTYAGWLQVADSGQDGSEVTVHLSFFEGNAPKDVEGALTSALDALAGLVES